MTQFILNECIRLHRWKTVAADWGRLSVASRHEETKSKIQHLAKDIALSASLRQWFNEDMDGRWDAFVEKYRKELEGSDKMGDFLSVINKYPAVTFLYLIRDTAQNHANVLQEYIERNI